MKRKEKEPEPTGPDETEVRQSAVIAATFANLELQSTKKTLQQYIKLYDELKEYNMQVEKKLSASMHDCQKIAEHLREQVVQKDNMLREQKKRAEEEMDKTLHKFNSERQELLAQLGQKEQAIEKLKTETRSLQADLDALEAFREERNDMQLEMSAFKDQHRQAVEKYEAEISLLRFQSLEEKVRLKAEEKALAEKFESRVNESAQNMLDAKTKEIHTENFMLLQDKVILEKELSKLAAANQQFTEQMGELKRDAQLSKTAEDEFSRRNVKKQRENKDLIEKVKTLEENLSKVVTEYESRIARAEAESKKTIAALREECLLANRNAESRHKELVKIRQLSRSIVKQRSDLELFFNEALEYVRGEVAKEKHEFLLAHGNLPPGKLAASKPPLPISGPKGSTPAKRGNSSQHPFFQSTGFEPIYESAGGQRESSAPTRTTNTAGSLPPISSKPSSARDALAITGESQQQQQGEELAAPRVDVSQLSWLEKERVLRILFAKISAVNQARNERREQGDAGPPRIGYRPQRQESGNSNTFVTQQ